MVAFRQRILFSIAALSLTIATAAADSSESKSDSKQPTVKSEHPVKTLGGMQYWGDLVWHHGWRIQRHVKTGHHRLLDPKNYRYKSGTLKECKLVLKQTSDEKKLGPMKGKAVILIHGILRSSKSFSKLSAKLNKEGFVVVGFDYPSAQVELNDQVEYLHSVIKSLEGIEEINFVVHSMGGLLVRTYLMKHKDQRDKRLKRFVMMGVPNKGAEMADLLKSNPLFKAVFGPAGQQLVTDPKTLIGKLPTPDFEFGVIAGGRGNDKGFNPLIPGDDDGTVAVQSTRLPGATDFILVSAMHSFLMWQADAMTATVEYLKTGKFRENEPARPISPDDESEKADSGAGDGRESD